MVFTAPNYINKIPYEIPSNVPIHEFLFSEPKKYGRYPIEESLAPFTCGITGKAYSALEVKDRIEHLAAGLAAELGLKVAEGTEFDKVIGIYSVNTIDSLTASWATHRLNGASSPISPSYSVGELTRQLLAVKCKALFTCAPLYATAVEAAAAAGLPKEHVYILEIPEKACKGAIIPAVVKTVAQLIEEGKKAEPLPKLQFTKNQAATQTAFLCSSSGTSGLPKNVKISHRNVIGNVLQTFSHELNYKAKKPETSLGALPLSHSYALIVTGHLGIYRGDGLIVLPGFDLLDVLNSVQTYKMGRLWMVPPMVVAMIKASAIAEKYDLSSVKTVVVGASNLTKDVADQFKKLFSHCSLVQGYGLTESAVVVCFQNPHDIMFGACGHIFPGYQARLMDSEGKEVTEYNKPGELHLRSPSVMLGYLDNEEATKEAFSEDGWLRTGDLFELRQSEKGNEHMFIVDRMKELIKVRGIQVSPTELETYLARHPAIADNVVVPIPNEAAGELPIAFIVRTPEGKAKDEKQLKEEIHTYLNADMADYKRLAGGIEFVDSLPKTAANKTQRGTMKQKAKAIYEATKAKPPPAVLQSFEFDSDDDDSDDDE